jgi:hypothetical protein
MLYTALPLLRGWMYQWSDKSGILGIGEERIIERFEAPGWILDIFGRFEGSRDAKYAKIRVEIDGPDRAYPIVFSAYDLRLANLTMPINHGVFLTYYNDTEGAYVMALSTSQPVPFCRRVEIKIIAPTAPVEETTAIPLKYRIVYTIAKVIDRDEFMRSLHELLGSHVAGR